MIPVSNVSTQQAGAGGLSEREVSVDLYSKTLTLQKKFLYFYFIKMKQ